MKKILLSFCLLIVPFFSFGCLNGITKILKNGVFVYEDHRGIVPHGHHFSIDNFESVIKSLDSLYTKTKDLDYLSDKGYVLVLQNKYSEALEIYLNIEKLQPNRYETASNIGTIYELMGENKKAHEWISKAMKINPKSHEGSEWLHLKILETKIDGLKNLSSDFLLDTNFGNESEPKSNLSLKELNFLKQSLYYQLNERISFIKGKDEIMAVLLFDLANLAFTNKEYHDAIEIYKKARDYGFDNNLLNERMDVSRYKIEDDLRTEIFEIYSVNEYHRNLFVITLTISSILVVVMGAVIFKIKKSKS